MSCRKLLPLLALTLLLGGLVSGCGTGSGPASAEPAPASGPPAPNAAGSPPVPVAGAPPQATPRCVADGGFDDVLDRWSCCSGVVVPGTVVCLRSEDHGGTWDSCLQICGTRLTGGCVPPGGIDDKLEGTKCCSARTATGSTRCLNPADYGTTWKSCVHTCA